LEPEQLKVHIPQKLRPFLQAYAKDKLEDGEADAARKLIKIALLSEGYKIKEEEAA